MSSSSNDDDNDNNSIRTGDGGWFSFLFAGLRAWFAFFSRASAPAILPSTEQEQAPHLLSLERVICILEEVLGKLEEGQGKLEEGLRKLDEEMFKLLDKLEEACAKEAELPDAPATSVDLPVGAYQHLASFLILDKDRLSLAEQCRNARDGVEAFCTVALAKFKQNHPNRDETFDDRIRDSSNIVTTRQNNQVATLPSRYLLQTAMTTHLYKIDIDDNLRNSMLMSALYRNRAVENDELYISCHDPPPIEELRAMVLFPSEGRVAIATTLTDSNRQYLEVWDLFTRECLNCWRIPEEGSDEGIFNCVLVDGRLVSCSDEVTLVWKESADGEWNSTVEFRGSLDQDGEPIQDVSQWVANQHELLIAYSVANDVSDTRHDIMSLDVQNGEVRTKFRMDAREENFAEWDRLDLLVCNGKWLLVYMSGKRPGCAFQQGIFVFDLDTHRKVHFLEGDYGTRRGYENDRRCRQIDQSPDHSNCICVMNGARDRVTVLKVDENGHLSIHKTFQVDARAHLAALFKSRAVVFAGGKFSVYNAETGDRLRSWVCEDWWERVFEDSEQYQAQAVVCKNRNELVVAYEGIVLAAFGCLEEPRV